MNIYLSNCYEINPHGRTHINISLAPPLATRGPNRPAAVPTGWPTSPEPPSMSAGHGEEEVERPERAHRKSSADRERNNRVLFSNSEKIEFAPFN